MLTDLTTSQRYFSWSQTVYKQIISHFHK